MALGLMTLLGPKWKHHGKERLGCPLMGQMMNKAGGNDASADMTSDMKGDSNVPQKVEAKNPHSAPTASSTDSSKTMSAGGTQSQEVPKSVTPTPDSSASTGKTQGNGGNFKGGTNW